MNKELENLLDNYENAIYGQAFPITPSIHQLHLLLDYIANLEQQCKKQKEVIDKVNEVIDKMINVSYSSSVTLYCATGEDSEFGTRAKIIKDILNEVSK